MATISIIACIAKGNRAIGYQNRLLYHIKSDMTRFRELTTGHAIIMGRKTYESLPNGALPKRRNIVVSKTLQNKLDENGFPSISLIPDCEVYPSLEEAIYAAIPNHSLSAKEESWLTSNEEIFVIGGERIYQEALPLANTLYLTLVDDTPTKADAFFPEIDLSEWEEVEKEMRNENGIAFTFLTYIRR